MTVGTDTAPVSVGYGDINGDGKIDLLSSTRNDDSVSIALGNGDGTFAAHTSVGVGVQPWVVVADDVNNDGDLDIVTVNRTELSVSILLGNDHTISAVSKINVSTTKSAQDLIPILDDTIDKLTNSRADLGNLYSRIETAQTANALQQESLSTARSLLEDADFAIETTELVRLQVLQQAQVAVQTQANVELQVVLGLLSF